MLISDCYFSLYLLKIFLFSISLFSDFDFNSHSFGFFMKGLQPYPIQSIYLYA